MSVRKNNGRLCLFTGFSAGFCLIRCPSERVMSKDFGYVLPDLIDV